MAIPLPGSPSSTWAIFRSRLGQAFAGADPRVCTAFWLFGLINNVLYVIILTAALDLVGPNVPKSTVLLADVIPSFLVKLVAPYFIQAVPYHVRILAFVALSATGMLLVALTPSYHDGGSMSTKMAGVILASLSSGAGELTFLGMVHYYGSWSLAAWGSGTGGAGLIGAGAYALATNTFKLSIKTTLLASACLPGVMLLSFFAILPLEPLKKGPLLGTRTLEDTLISSSSNDHHFDAESEHLLTPASPSIVPVESPKPTNSTLLASHHSSQSILTTLKSNLRRTTHLIIPYMLPLFLVYIAEYTINLAIAPTLLFPLKDTPFTSYREFYPVYSTLYQTGVFISRTLTIAILTPLLGRNNDILSNNNNTDTTTTTTNMIPKSTYYTLYVPTFLQLLNLAILLLHATTYTPNSSPSSSSRFSLLSLHTIFPLFLYEGLLGGFTYVATYHLISLAPSSTIPAEEKEFSLSVVTVSDSAGITVAGMVGLWLEPWVCGGMVGRGWDACRKL